MEATPEPTPVTPTRLAAAMKADGGVPGVLEPNARVMLVGEALQLASGDKVKAAHYAEGTPTTGEPTATCEVASSALVSNQASYLTFNWSEIGDALDHPASGTLRFSVLKGGVQSNAVDAVVSAE